MGLNKLKVNKITNKSENEKFERAFDRILLESA